MSKIKLSDFKKDKLSVSELLSAKGGLSSSSCQAGSSSCEGCDSECYGGDCCNETEGCPVIIIGPIG